ncbi:MAG: Sjogren's syndrome/scleroderma autoantigen 1 family protein [Halobacteria archaeon]|nr:Sjogren's syndrome/scleroderma autoantigen 1 family protein [Halobacteria archaeon]
MADDSDLMSDLLLRGVTMLGDECPECGNPLFRHNDDVFCAACDPDEARRILGESKNENHKTHEEATRREVSQTEKTEGDRRDTETQRSGERSQNQEVVRSLSKVARRLADEAEDERDLSRLSRILDSLDSTLDIIERLS